MISLFFHLFCAVFIAGMVGYDFYNTWLLEHGKCYDNSMFPYKSKHTVVLTSASSLILILPLIAVWSVIFEGVRAGLQLTGFMTIDVMIIFSLYIPVLYVCLPFLRKHFSARVCALLWTVPVFLFYNVFMLLNNLWAPLYQIYVPKRVLLGLFAVWGTGFVLVFGYYVIQDVIFERRVFKNSAAVTDERILNIWNAVREELEYHDKTKLLISSIVEGPFSMGSFSFNRSTVLPARDYSDAQLSMIFSHELHHLQRNDVSTKIFINFLTALCWFNPLVWLALRKAVEDLELSCDEIVVQSLDSEKRVEYAALLLNNAMPRHGFTTCLSASAGVLRYRMRQVVKPREVRKGTILLMAVTFACFMIFRIFSVTTEQGTIDALIPENVWDNTLVTLDSDHGSTSFTSNAYMSEAENKQMTNRIRKAIGTVMLQKIEICSDCESMGDGSNVQILSMDTLYNITLYNDLLVLSDLDSNYTYYKVVSPVDWEALDAAVE